MPAVTNSPPTKDKPTLRGKYSLHASPAHTPEALVFCYYAFYTSDTTQSMKQNIASHVLSDQAKNVLQDLQLSDGEHGGLIAALGGGGCVVWEGDSFF